MSVLINGMEMPTSPVLFCIHPNGKVFDVLEGRWRERKAVPVPEHGDLIDRKAVCLTDFEVAMCDGDYKEGMKMLLEKIESAPTIIPEEEKSNG